MVPALQRVKNTKYGGRKKKTRKKNKLSLSDYRKILKFYKMKIPKSASKIRKEGNKIIAKKFCSCIKKVRKKFKKEGIAIGICTKSVITRKNIKRGKFKCKKRRTIKLYKGGGGTQSKLTDTIENKSHEFDIIVDLYPENFYGEQFMVTKAGECHKALGVMQGLFKNKYPAVASTKEAVSLEHFNKTASKPENFLNQMKADGEVDKYFRKFFHNVEDNVMYLISMNTSDHSFTIEINGEYMRIISLYGTRHGFKEYHEQSRFGKYFKIGGEVYLEMMENFRKINNFAIKNEMYLGNSYEMIFVNNDGEEKFNAAIDAHTDLFGYGEGVTRNDYIDIYRRGAPHGKRSMGYRTYDMVNFEFGREYKYTIDEKMQQGGHLRPLISHEDEEYEGGNKSKKIKDIVKIFKQYPDIFPRGYFRYLPATLEKHHKKGTLIYKNGVVLTYTKYKKTVNKYKKYKIKPGDVKLNQLVNKEQGNGEAKKIFLKFMEKHKDSNLLLDVLAGNKKAIRFYRKNGFRKIDETKFGDKLKGIVMLKRSKKNKTRKKKN